MTRRDLSPKRVATEYEASGNNMSRVAEKLSCSVMTVKNRLTRAGVSTGYPETRKELKRKTKPEKLKQARYICRDLGLADILLKRESLDRLFDYRG